MFMQDVHLQTATFNLRMYTWRITDLNRWPLRCDRSALPTELIPLGVTLLTNISYFNIHLLSAGVLFGNILLAHVLVPNQ